MTFILRIFFVGLIAFVPRQDGQELTVLLVETGPEAKTSNSLRLPPHNPMLLAQAGQCRGDCGIQDADNIARFVFPKDVAADAAKFLSAALANGAAWKLDGSDLSIVDAGRQTPGALRIHGEARETEAPWLLPKNADEGMDFRWVAKLGRIVPSAGTVDPDLLARRPPSGRISARFQLRSGRLWTYRLVRVKGMIPTFDFKTRACAGAKTGESQVLADWVAAEIEVSGDDVEIVENRFTGGKETRKIRLAPRNGLVELLVMNVPPPPRPGEVHHTELDRATHFAAYYDLTRTPPPLDQRPVPCVGTSAETKSPSELGNKLRSRLLEDLKLGDAKGFYERIICPVAQLSEDGNL